MAGWPNDSHCQIVSTVLAVGVGIGAMVFSSTASLRGEIKTVRSELSDEIRGLDARLPTVEQDVAVMKARLPVGHPVTTGASPLDHEEDDADA